MIITSVIASSPRRSVPLLGRVWANTVPRLDHRVQPAHQQSSLSSLCYTWTMDSEAYDWTAYMLTLALQTAAPEAAWKTATINELMQAGSPLLAEHFYIVEARVPVREFLLRKRMSRSVVEQDMREAVELLVQLLNTRLAPELQV